ncbi:hypothetical protein MLD38_021050 [Melastoma candidum]|uniref:Uncharacterized protein n=1 Tax=Melastoma candidum TaxID=119954 RepID=A0ACB9QFT9_9MYRT|nr:hypothetical protein MLD38_021050 [Melastoma candidum]
MWDYQRHDSSAAIVGLYHYPAQKIEHFSWSDLSPMDDGEIPDLGPESTFLSFQTNQEQLFTLESSLVSLDPMVHDSPSTVGSTISTANPFSQSSVLDQFPTSHGSCFSPASVSSGADFGYELRQKIRELEISLLGPESSELRDMRHNCFFNNEVQHTTPLARQVVPKLSVKEMLFTCARSISDGDMVTAAFSMDSLEKKVSVTGDPVQRLGAYMLEGLRARLESSGKSICRKLKCNEPTGSELLSSMHVLYEICPYWKFAYTSANVILSEAMENESKVHIVDFQIAQGSQWAPFIQALAVRPGGPPFLCITGIDDSDSAYARGGGIEMVAQSLSQIAESCGVPFEFHNSGVSSSEVDYQHLRIRPGEALAVNFPYILHHVPDESMSTENHRDRILRLIKSLMPKVVTLLEQESNTNTSPFIPRFLEMLDYYTAMFESIDAARPRDDKKRISAEQHCVARDIVNMVACEGADRVERHELLGKWRSRLTMAGFHQLPLSRSVGDAICRMLREYSENYRVDDRDGALYLRWINRAMVTCSAWR